MREQVQRAGAPAGRRQGDCARSRAQGAGQGDPRSQAKPAADASAAPKPPQAARNHHQSKDGDRPARAAKHRRTRGASSTRRNRDAGETGGRRGRREKPRRNRHPSCSSQPLSWSSEARVYFGGLFEGVTDPAAATTDAGVAANDSAAADDSTTGTSSTGHQKPTSR